MMVRETLEKTNSKQGRPGLNDTESGYCSETWSDGTHSFLLKYSPERCSIYQPVSITNESVITVAESNGIVYELEPIIDGEVVTVARNDGMILMRAVHEAITAENGP